jgi:hypothetical protein
MNPIRRELLNGLFVLVVASLLSAVFAAFQVSINVEHWVLIIVGMAVAVSGYVVFEFVLSNQEGLKKTEQRELEWLKRVGNPARLEMGLVASSAGTALVVQAVKTIRPGTDYTMMLYIDRAGGTLSSSVSDESRAQIYGAIMEQLRRGTIREYKRLICFDHDVLANDPELRSGVLRVGEGPGNITRSVAEHCRLMMETKGCSVYVAPVVLRNSTVALLGPDQVTMSIDTVDQDTGTRHVAGIMIFYDPPNGEIIEQFRQIERATERRMVAVHKIRFPEDAEPTATVATR